MNDIKNTVSQLERRFRELTPEEIIAGNKFQADAVDAEYQEFHEAYQKGICYLCNRTFDDVDEMNPCMHILLRRKMFKKELYKSLFKDCECLRIAAFLRWVANEEISAKKINDLKDESAANKVFNETITWKNVEWTFDCSQSDFEGHQESEIGKDPHWHFQMKFDGFVFIKFNEYHIKFKDYDLVTLSLIKDNAIDHTFGKAGIGMQNVMDFAEKQPELFLKNSRAAKDYEEKASVRVQSMFSAQPGETFSGEDIYQAMEMSKKTGQPISVCLQEIFGDKCSASFVVSPSDDVPEIAKRGKRKKRL